MRHLLGRASSAKGVVVGCPKLLDSPTVLPPAATSSPKNLPTGASLTSLSSMRAPRLQTSGSMTSRGLYTPVGASAAARKEEGRERLETGGRGPQGSQQPQKNCRRKESGGAGGRRRKIRSAVVKRTAGPVRQPPISLHQMSLGDPRCSGPEVFSEGRKEGQKHDQGTRKGARGGGHAFAGRRRGSVLAIAEKPLGSW